MPSLQKILYSRREAAQIISLSLRSIDYLIENGELLARRVGRRVLIERAELERFALRDHSTDTDEA